jgi:glutathione S-transferase
VKLDAVCAAYCETILAWAPVVLWTEGALAEPEEMEELEAEF